MTENHSEEKKEPAWFIDEGIPGIGDRPSWLPDKFKTAADLAKSHTELEKRLGTVPDDYDLTKSKYLDPDYVPFHDLKKLAKEKRVPQDVFDKMLESVDKYMDEFSIDMEEEVKKLGENGRDRVVTVDNWAKANLSKDAYEALKANVNNAESFKALEELRGKMMTSITQVPGNSGVVNAPASVKDIQMEMSTNLEKYKTDDAYRKDLQRRLEIAVKNDPAYIDKVGG